MLLETLYWGDRRTTELTGIVQGSKIKTGSDVESANSKLQVRYSQRAGWRGSRPRQLADGLGALVDSVTVGDQFTWHLGTSGVGANCPIVARSPSQGRSSEMCFALRISLMWRPISLPL